jgi:SNF2 family DNA or RNA helicase
MSNTSSSLELDLPVVPKRLSLTQINNLKPILSHCLTVDLMNHQVEGITWMKSMEKSSYSGGGLADDMGLGKTLQTIVTCVLNGVNSTLIVCPNALTSNWVQEFASKLNVNVKVVVFQGQRRNKISLDDYNVVITTYGTLLVEHGLGVASPLFSRHWHRVVLDESQHIKNYECKTAKATFALNSTYRWCISGTPVQNNMEELYASLKFLRIPNYEQHEYFMNNIIFNDDIHAASSLVDILFLRRYKSKILRLKPKKIIEYPCPMSDEERKLYAKLNWRLRTIIPPRVSTTTSDGQPPPRPQPRSSWSQIQTLRMACNNVRISVSRFDKNVEEETVESIVSSKEYSVSQLVETLVSNGEKVLVFSSFLRNISRLSSLLEKSNIVTFVLTGSQNTRTKRDAVITSFKQAPKACALVMQTTVGSVGLNLTEATSVIIVEPWWNPFVDEQAMDRAYRIGQKHQVKVFKCFTPNTIEERIIALQEQKKIVVDDLWNGGGSNLGSNGGFKLSKKDVDFLLNAK